MFKRGIIPLIVLAICATLFGSNPASALYPVKSVIAPKKVDRQQVPKFEETRKDEAGRPRREHQGRFDPRSAPPNSVPHAPPPTPSWPPPH